jgi:hypothetical protein
VIFVERKLSRVKTGNSARRVTWKKLSGGLRKTPLMRKRSKKKLSVKPQTKLLVKPVKTLLAGKWRKKKLSVKPRASCPRSQADQEAESNVKSGLLVKPMKKCSSAERKVKRSIDS